MELNQKLMRRALGACLMIGLAVALVLGPLVLAPGSQAETPDGETPAVEDICTNWGMTGKVNGLCNAYCEAMDCDSAEPNASETACQIQYGAIMETTGEEPPCVGDASAPTVECPCAAEWWRMDLYPENPTDVSCTSVSYPPPAEISFFQLDVMNSPTDWRNISVITGDDPDDFGLCVPFGQLTCGEHTWICGSGRGGDTAGGTGTEGGTLLFNYYPQRPESHSLFQQLLSDVCEQDIRLIAAEFGAECPE